MAGPRPAEAAAPPERATPAQIYTSTRDTSVAVTFEEAIVRGFSAEGGLFVPTALPPPRDAAFWAARAGRPFVELATEVIGWFVGEHEIPRPALERIVRKTAAAFSHPEVTPVRRWPAAAAAAAGLPPLDVLELFHGPTLAFKDLAMQFLLNCLQHFCQQRGRRLAVLVATTGDTGPAAMEAARRVPEVDCTVLYTRGRISALQEVQMLTPTEPNVHAVSVPATSDELDAVLRALFDDRAFTAEVALGTVNSFNWARVLFQSVAYIYACLNLPGTATAAAAAAAAAAGGLPPVQAYVPAGGFGNGISALYAQWLGLPLTVVACTNENDTLVRLVCGEAVPLPVRTVPTLSPCMDISVPSNLERLMYHGWARARGAAQPTAADVASIAATVRALATVDAVAGADGAAVQLAPELLAVLRACVHAVRVSSTETAAALCRARVDHGAVLDPHTAVAYSVWRAAPPDDDGRRALVVGTASPAKFYRTLADAYAAANLAVPFADVDPARLAKLQQSPQCLRAESAAEAEALLRRQLPVWLAQV